MSERKRDFPRTEIQKDMAVWFQYGSARTLKSRTPEQRAWDAAIHAAAEFVRRRMNYNEALSAEILGMTTETDE